MEVITSGQTTSGDMRVPQHHRDDPLDEKHLGAFSKCFDNLNDIQRLLVTEISRLQGLETKEIKSLDLSSPGWTDFEIKEIQEFRGFLSNVVLKFCKNRIAHFTNLRRSYSQDFRKDTTLRIGESERACLVELQRILGEMKKALSFQEFEGPYRFKLRGECEEFVEEIKVCLRKVLDEDAFKDKSWFRKYESRGQDELVPRHLDEIAFPQNSSTRSELILDCESQLPVYSCVSLLRLWRWVVRLPLKYMEYFVVLVSVVAAVLISVLEDDVGSGFTVGAYLLGGGQIPIATIWKCKNWKPDNARKGSYTD